MGFIGIGQRVQLIAFIGDVEIPGSFARVIHIDSPDGESNTTDYVVETIPEGTAIAVKREDFNVV